MTGPSPIAVFDSARLPGRDAAISTPSWPTPTGKKQYSLTSKAFRNALEQVSNSLVASQKNREFREQQELLTQAAQKTDQLSEVLYRNGGARYLQVLTGETSSFSAKLNLVEAQLNERLALVQLYQALGGGWQQ